MTVNLYRYRTPPVRGSAWSFEVALVSQADAKKFQSNPTLAAGDVAVSKDGGAYANITSLPTAIGAGVTLTVSLSAAEMTTDRVCVRFIDQAGAQWCDLLVEFFTVESVVASSFNEASQGVIVTTNNDKTGYSLTTPPPTASEIATAVWTYVNRTLTSFGDLAQEFWEFARRTLTVPASSTSTVDPTALTVYNNSTIDIVISNLGSLADVDEIWFTVKDRFSLDSTPDSGALIQISHTAGLLYIVGTAAATPANGSITITDEAGIITVVLKPAEGVKLPGGTYFYDVKFRRSGGEEPVILAGKITVNSTATKTV